MFLVLSSGAQFLCSFYRLQAVEPQPRRNHLAQALISVASVQRKHVYPACSVYLCTYIYILPGAATAVVAFGPPCSSRGAAGLGGAIPRVSAGGGSCPGSPGLSSVGVGCAVPHPGGSGACAASPLSSSSVSAVAVSPSSVCRRCGKRGRGRL